MNTNNQKIAFIICVNNELYFSECQYYISRLEVPENFEVEVLAIREATSMCAAYNLGMQSSDAKYKVYMHQDVFIRNNNFIAEIVERFLNNEKVGMIGMAGGTGMPKTGVTYLAWNEGIVDCREPDMAYRLICGRDKRQDVLVDAADGLLLATQYDILWREDLFVDFDFYDISQCFEMKRKGYDILVPYQKEPWVIHDSSFAKLNNYDKNRKICLLEYPEFFTEEDGFEFVYNKEWETLSDELVKMVKLLMDAGEWQQVAAVIAEYRKNNMKNSALEMYAIMLELQQKTGFFDGMQGYDAVYQKYTNLRFLLRRMEVGMPESAYEELTEAIRQKTVTPDALLRMFLYSVLDKKTVSQKVMKLYEEAEMKPEWKKVKQFYEMVKDKPLPVGYSKRISKA